MATDMKRFTISVTKDMESDLDMLKQAKYYNDTGFDCFRHTGYEKGNGFGKKEKIELIRVTLNKGKMCYQKKEEDNMMKIIKQVLLVLAIVVTITTIIVVDTRIVSADSTFDYASGEYIITDDTQMEVQFTGLSKKSATSVEIPSTIKINEQEYKVTGVKANALNGNKKVKKLIIGENVKVIGKKAFYGCKNLKSITINTFNLKAKTVGTAAFKGLNAKVVITVPENKLKAYKKILKSKGLTGKKQAVKGRKIETEKKDEEELDPNRDIPSPATMFTIDNYFGLMSNIREEDGYSIGDSIPITAGFQMHYLMYGKAVTRTVNGGFWIRCDDCGQMFDNQDDYFKISSFEVNDCKDSGSFVFGQDY